MAAPAARGRLKTAVISRNGLGTQVIEAAVAGARVSVVYLAISAGAATADPSLESSAGTVLAGPWDMAQDTNLVLQGTRLDPVVWTAVGEGLTLRVAGAGLVSGLITYLVETGL